MEHESRRRGVYVDHKMVVTVAKGVCRLSNGSFLPRNNHGVPVPRVALTRLSRLFSRWAKGSGRFRKNQARKTKIDTRDAVGTSAKKKRNSILEERFERVECQEHNFHKRPMYLKKKTETFPYAIVFDFEARASVRRRQKTCCLKTSNYGPLLRWQTL